MMRDATRSPMSDTELSRSLRIVAAALAAFVLVGGVLSLLGWLLDVPRLTDWQNSDVSIQGNSAAMLAICGLSALLYLVGFRKIVVVLGFVVAVAGALFVAQHFTGRDFGINHQLLFGRTWGQSTTVTPGRMGPPASASLLLLGVAILLLGATKTGSSWRGLIPKLTTAVALICAFSLVGYLFQARHFYAIPWRTAIAFQTTTMLVSIAVALTIVVHEQQPMRILREHSAAGLLARRVLPLLVILPPLISFLRVKGEELRFYDPGTGIALSSILMIVILVGIMWSALLVVSRHEQREREADRKKDEFLATLAHELRNPLAPLRNALHILRLKDSQSPEVVWSRDVIDRQLQQMTRLVDDLLDVSRISRGKIELRRERVELSQLVERAVETSRPLIDQGKHQLIVSIPETPILISADVIRVAQIFSNLLNNAAKFSDPGGQIHLSAEVRDKRVVVRVKDTGIGIPADKLARVFDLFTQVDHSIEKSHGGLGIGLTLVDRLVQLHGGTVSAHSDGIGKGSEFIVTLPLAGAPFAQAREPIAWAAGGNGRTAGSTRRILIADDNRDAAESLGMMLQLSGNEIRMAFDGVEAVSVAEEFRPDVALLDIGLPGMNGYDVARRIRERAGNSSIVLIAVTGWGQDEHRRRSKDAGFDHHLVKPVAPRVIIDLLATL